MELAPYVELLCTLQRTAELLLLRARAFIALLVIVSLLSLYTAMSVDHRSSEANATPAPSTADGGKPGSSAKPTITNTTPNTSIPYLDKPPKPAEAIEPVHVPPVSRPPSAPDTHLSTNASSTASRQIFSISIFFADFSRHIELQNLKHFCMYGVRVNDSTIDYEIVIVTPEAIYTDDAARARIMDMTVPTFVRTAPNVHITWRINEGTDLCTFAKLCKEQEFAAKVFYASHGKNYTHFWLMNGTVRGPFVPAWNLRKDIPWWEPFFSAMEAEPAVDVVSSYGSCEANVMHCQSMALLTTRRGFNLAVSTFYCQRENQARLDWIWDTEVKFSQRLLKAGMNAKTLLGIWGAKDLRYVASLSQEQLAAQKICQLGNPYVIGYQGTYPNPLETVFFKFSNAMAPNVPGHVKAFMESLERTQYEVAASLRPEMRALNPTYRRRSTRVGRR